MQKPEIVLDILRNRSENNLKVMNVHKLLYNPDFYTKFTKLSNENITSIISSLRAESYKFGNNLEVDKELYNVIFQILDSIYSSRFKQSLQYKVHTALTRVRQKGKACEFFIHSKLLDTSKIPFKVLINFMNEVIDDQRFLTLLRKLLIACKFDKCINIDDAFSGTIKFNNDLFTLLYNIYLYQFDLYIENTLVSKYNYGETRKRNIKYNRLKNQILDHSTRFTSKKDKLNDEEKHNKIQKLKNLRKQYRTLNCREPIENDDSFRRLSYTRYSNEWLITFTGTFQEAMQIKEDILKFYDESLELHNQSVTIHKSNDKKHVVRFLNYGIITQWDNDKLTNGKKCLGGEIGFLVPKEIVLTYTKPYLKDKKPIHINRLVNKNLYDIITYFQMQLRGLLQYYKFARNQDSLTIFRHTLEVSLIKTIACKYKTSCSKVYKKYGSHCIVNGFKYKTIEGSITTKDGLVKHVHFGAIPLKRQIALNTHPIVDSKSFYNYNAHSYENLKRSIP